MAPRNHPPFRADHVGSLLRPKELVDAREKKKRGEISAEALREAEDKAIRDVVKLQEDIGFEVATDGEFRRTFWHLDFLEQFANVTVVPPSIKASFHTHAGDIQFAPPGIRIDGKLSRPHPIFVDHFKFLKSVAKVTPKLTIPAPSNMHFRGGRKAIDAKAYPDLGEFYADLARVYNEEVRDLAAAGCRYLQIDEVNFAYLCDPKLREQVQNIGSDPRTLPQTYATLINQSLAGKPADMVTAMHLCRGNFRSAWVAEGGYEPVADVLFNQIDVTGYFLEYDDERSGDFAPLRFVPKGKVVILGLVTTKLSHLETKDALKRRIEEAAKYCPLDQLALSPQCGFSSTIEGNNITLGDEIAKLKLVVETAREVWG
ncbi:MAG TPA: 5-methyltetrahydropteroyltriglutamate--homocysteine S-methyltransferase [Stellaceae bacterium]|jgi:5-methyltetrahydropteroyltriglutamate--homocysteine methyltransferase|nr:5-methyltetrahydropteroyltriglutamate--homocysteine S-methyltransferase [Stellaceae bacterium]